jgi:hypothetical protein
LAWRNASVKQPLDLLGERVGIRNWIGVRLPDFADDLQAAFGERGKNVLVFIDAESRIRGADTLVFHNSAMKIDGVSVVRPHIRRDLMEDGAWLRWGIASE